jgi:hypothetical protein
LATAFLLEAVVVVVVVVVRRLGRPTHGFLEVLRVGVHVRVLAGGLEQLPDVFVHVVELVDVESLELVANPPADLVTLGIMGHDSPPFC